MKNGRNVVNCKQDNGYYIQIIFELTIEERRENNLPIN